MIDYTTVLNTGATELPLLPLILVLTLPIVIFAVTWMTRAQAMQGAVRIGLWSVYALYASMTAYQYWTQWNDRAAARQPDGTFVVAGVLDAPTVRQTQDGIFIDIHQRFAVKDVEIDYRRHMLRFAGFLLPQPELVALPLKYHAHVRITYREDGQERQLVKFEMAAHEWEDFQSN